MHLGMYVVVISQHLLIGSCRHDAAEEAGGAVLPARVCGRLPGGDADQREVRPGVRDHQAGPALRVRPADGDCGLPQPHLARPHLPHGLRALKRRLLRHQQVRAVNCPAAAHPPASSDLLQWLCWGLGSPEGCSTHCGCDKPAQPTAILQPWRDACGYRGQVSRNVSQPAPDGSLTSLRQCSRQGGGRLATAD